MIREALEAWRAKPMAEQYSYFDGLAEARIDPAIRDAVRSCPHRGPEGAVPLTDAECSGCGGGVERTACDAGLYGGRPTLRDCLACKS
jgi:hypothetical protein